MSAPDVVGLDLSMAATGVAHTQTGEVACTHLISPATKGDDRLVEIKRRVLDYCTSATELILIEDLPPVRGYALAILGMVHGSVRSALIERVEPYATVTVAGLKKFATGKGTASKTDMAVAAFKRAGLEFKNDNECDAWWLWVMAHDYLGAPLFELPKVNREALTKIKPGPGR